MGNGSAETGQREGGTQPTVENMEVGTDFIETGDKLDRT